MRNPRRWEVGDGLLEILQPLSDDLRDVRAGVLTIDQYRDRYLAYVRNRLAIEDRTGGLPGWSLRPGALGIVTGTGFLRVADGDTLCCACSREDAAAGRCHRCYAAELLVEAGWTIVADGVEGIAKQDDELPKRAIQQELF